MSGFEVGNPFTQLDGVKRAAAVEQPESQESLPPLPKGRPAIPIDDYVEQARVGARLVGETEMRKRGAPENEKQRKEWMQDIEERVERAERNARQRHAGFLAGEIVSL